MIDGDVLFCGDGLFLGPIGDHTGRYTIDIQLRLPRGSAMNKQRPLHFVPRSPLASLMEELASFRCGQVEKLCGDYLWLVRTMCVAFGDETCSVH